MSDIISGLTPIQIFFIAMSIIGTVLAGNNNSWSWIFSILAMFPCVRGLEVKRAPGKVVELDAAV